MLPGDTDAKRDVYERYFDSEPGVETYVTREVSLGPAGGNDAFDATFEKVNKEGTKVFFSTEESLVEADTDHSTDVYMRNLENGKGTTTLVSPGRIHLRAGLRQRGNRRRLRRGQRRRKQGLLRHPGKADRGRQRQLGRHLRARPLDRRNRPCLRRVLLVPDGMRQRAPRRHVVGGLARRVLRLLHERRGARAGRRRHDHGHLRARTCRRRRDEARLEGRRRLHGVRRRRQGAGLPRHSGKRHPGLLLHRRKARRRRQRRRHGRLRPRSAERPDHPDLRGDGRDNGDLRGELERRRTRLLQHDRVPRPRGRRRRQRRLRVVAAAGTPSLVTTTPCSSNCVGATFDAASADSETVLFSTSAKLSSEDLDGGAEDIYAQEIGGGEPTLVSRGSAAAAAATAPPPPASTAPRPTLATSSSPPRKRSHPKTATRKTTSTRGTPWAKKRA